MSSIEGPPSAVYRTSLDRVICFVVAGNVRLFDKFWNGQQWVWEDHGNAPSQPVGFGASGPAAAIYQTSLDRVICFFNVANGHLNDLFWDGQQWVWEDQGTPPGGYGGSLSPVYQTSLDRVICFVAGNGLSDKFWDGQQWVWEDQGKPPGTGTPSYNLPSAVYQSSLDRVICFVIGGDGHLYDKFWDGQQWVWEDQGTPPGTTVDFYPPSAVYQTSLDRVICFVLGQDGHLYDKFWDGCQWVWEDQGTPP